MKRKRGIQKWYIEPLDARTNEILARNQEFLSDEEIFAGVRCADGKPHCLWGCRDYAFVARLMRSRVSLMAVFLTWHQEGSGQIRQWIFPRKKSVKDHGRRIVA